MRNLDQNTRAVTGLGIAASRATMSQIDQYLETLADYLVTLLSADARDQSHTARIVLMLRMIKSLRVRNMSVTL